MEIIDSCNSVKLHAYHALVITKNVFLLTIIKLSDLAFTKKIKENQRNNGKKFDFV